MAAQGAQPMAERLSTGTIVCPATDMYPRNDEATAVLLKDGSILLAWSRFSGLNRSASRSTAYDPLTGLPGQDLNSDNAPAHIAAVISRDGGLTWSDAETLVADSAGLNVMNPSLARLTDDSLGLVYNLRESLTSAYRVFRRSLDEGRSWSAPIFITDTGYKTGCNDRLTVLDSGRLIAPIHCTDDWGSHYLHTRVAWSDNHGQTWSLSPALELPKVHGSGESGCWEPDVVQRADGSLLMVMRTAMGTLFRAESDDAGETWHGLRSMEVVAPVAPAILRRIPDTSALLLVWNWHYDWREAMGGRRRPLACAVSYDGGASWPTSQRHILEADPNFTYAYPSCLFVGDQAMITYYVSAADDPFGARSLKALFIPLASLHNYP